MPASAARTSEFASADALTSLERSVLLTVLYADLFDFALTEAELHERLVLRPAEKETLQRALRSLEHRFLSITGGFITWQGREQLAAVRRQRAATSSDLWETAYRYASWLSRVPFIRMVAVSGSLAVENAEPSSDIDVFCIAEAKRLWVARLFIVPMSKMTRLLPRIFPRYLCPNYLLTRSTLEVRDQNLFTAHEVAQTRPLYGFTVYDDFRRANTWVGRFLPRQVARTAAAKEPAKPLPSRLIERVLGGRLGDTVDAAIHRAFCSFYRRRAVRKGWTWQKLEEAYQRGRYTVPEGGYIPVVQSLYLDRLHERLGDTVDRSELRRLFPDRPQETGCYDWESLFRRDYGVAVQRFPSA